MYLHSATASSAFSYVEGKPNRSLPTLMSKTVGRELVNASRVRETMKDVTSAKLQVKAPKQAEALQFVESRYLRNQIKAFPTGLHETARISYLLGQNDKRKNLQDFQCNILIKLENILKSRLLEKGEDIRKYRIGGFDGGTYGKSLSLRFLPRIAAL
jgi:hypothetical protein